MRGNSNEYPQHIFSPWRGNSNEYPQHMLLWRTYSLESPQRGDSNEYPQHMFSPWRGDSNEYPQHMFLWRTGENYPLIIIKYPPYLFHCYGAVCSRSTLFAQTLGTLRYMPYLFSRYQAAKKDNDFVYHDKVPAADSLPEVKGSILEEVSRNSLSLAVLDFFCVKHVFTSSLLNSILSINFCKSKTIKQCNFRSSNWKMASSWPSG